MLQASSSHGTKMQVKKKFFKNTDLGSWVESMDDSNFTGLLCIEAQEESTVAAEESDNSGGIIIFLAVAVGIGGKPQQLILMHSHSRVIPSSRQSYTLWSH